MGFVVSFLLQKLEVRASTDGQCEMKNYSPCVTFVEANIVVHNKVNIGNFSKT